jgi:hypothetical protein
MIQTLAYIDPQAKLSANVVVLEKELGLVQM